MNDDRVCEIIRLLDSIDTTLREVNRKLDGSIDANELRETIRGTVRRDCGPTTVTDILVTPETEADKQGLDRWLEQLDKCKCPLQVRIMHEDCCERREQDEHI